MYGYIYIYIPKLGALAREVERDTKMSPANRRGGGGYMSYEEEDTCKGGKERHENDPCIYIYIYIYIYTYIHTYIHIL
jgi:hypothetical protein